jgi:hypothetical protein
MFDLENFFTTCGFTPQELALINKKMVEINKKYGASDQESIIRQKLRDLIEQLMVDLSNSSFEGVIIIPPTMVPTTDFLMDALNCPNPAILGCVKKIVKRVDYNFINGSDWDLLLHLMYSNRADQLLEILADRPDVVLDLDTIITEINCTFALLFANRQKWSLLEKFGRKVNKLNLNARLTNPSNPCNGMTVALELVAQGQFVLLEKLAEKASEPIDLNAAKTTHLKSYTNGITVAWYMLRQGQWQLFRKLGGTSIRINLNTSPLSEEDEWRGINIALILANKGQFELLDELVEKQLESINLNVMPMSRSEQRTWMSVAWILAYRQQWPLLQKMIDKASEPIDLNVCPPPQSEFFKKSLLELLMEAKQYDLLVAILKQHDLRMAMQLINVLWKKYEEIQGFQPLLEMINELYRKPLAIMRQILANVADQFEVACGAKVCMVDDAIGMVLDLLDGEMQLTKRGVCFVNDEVGLKTTALTVKKQDIAKVLKKVLKNSGLLISNKVSGVKLQFAAPITIAPGTIGKIMEGLIAVSKEYSEAKEKQAKQQALQAEQEALRAKLMAREQALQARIKTLQERYSETVIDQHACEIFFLIGCLREIGTQVDLVVKMEKPMMQEAYRIDLETVSKRQSRTITAETASAAKEVLTAFGKIEREYSKLLKRVELYKRELSCYRYVDELGRLKKAVVDSLAQINREIVATEESLSAMEIHCDAFEVAMTNFYAKKQEISATLKSAEAEKDNVLGDISRFTRSEAIEEYRRKDNKYRYCCDVGGEARPVEDKVVEEFVAKGNEAGSSKRFQAKRSVGEGGPAAAASSADFNDVRLFPQARKEKQLLSFADVPNSEEICNQLRDLADLRIKYNKEYCGQQCGCSSGCAGPASAASEFSAKTSGWKIFRFAYLYKLLLIFELMGSWRISSTAYKLRTGVMHGYYLINWRTLNAFLNKLIRIPDASSGEASASMTSGSGMIFEDYLQKLSKAEKVMDDSVFADLDLHGAMQDLHDTNLYRDVSNNEAKPKKNADLLKTFLDELVEVVNLANNYYKEYGKVFASSVSKDSKLDLPKDWSLIHECRDAVSMILVCIGEIYQSVRGDAKSNDLLELLNSSQWQGFFKECDYYVRQKSGHFNGAAAGGCGEAKVKFEPVSDLSVVELATKGAGIAKMVKAQIDGDSKLECVDERGLKT